MKASRRPPRAKPRVLTPPTIQRIHERRRMGIPFAEIARELGISHESARQGFEMAPPAVEGASTSGETTNPINEAPLEPVASTEANRDETTGPVNPGAMARDEIEKLVVALGEESRIARSTGETGQFIQIASKLAAAAHTLAKLTPPPPVNFDESPDMVDAARRGREKILERVRRSREGA